MNSKPTLKGSEAFLQLAAVPPELEWFANIQNPNTRAAYRKDLAQFMAFCGITHPEQFREIVRAHIIAWRQSLQTHSPASVRRKLAAIASLFNYLCEKNAVTHNPVHGVSRPKGGANEGKTPALSDDQARALLQAPQGTNWQIKRDRAMLAVLLYHGLRASEVCALTLGDYAERRGLRTLTILGKGSKVRYIPVHPKAAEVIAEYIEASGHLDSPKAWLFVSAPRKGAPPAPMQRQRIRDLISRYAAAAGLPANLVRPHALRATAATNALEHGADIARVQDWLGHANPATTRLYDKRSDRPTESPTFRVSF